MDSIENGSGSGPSGLTFSPLFRKGLAAAAVVLAADQITKWWILSAVMQPPRIIPVTPFFNLVLGWNQGVSFGMLNFESQLSDWLLPIAVIAITVALGVWLYRADRLRVAAALGLIIGGAIGNLVDRLRFGAVLDFLDFYAAGFHWPAFNLADSGITVGAIVLILDSLFVSEEKP